MVTVIMENKFYVYIYLDPRKPGNYKYENIEFSYQPFYVGRGHGNRINSHLHKIGRPNVDNSYFHSKLNRIFEETRRYPIRCVLERNLTYVGSVALERKLIRNIGRRDLCKGPLCNHTNGGDGVEGLPSERNGMYGKGYKLKGEKNGMFGVTGKEHHAYGKPGYWLGKKMPREVVDNKTVYKGDDNPMRKKKLAGEDLTPWWKGLTIEERLGPEKAAGIRKKMSDNHANFVGAKNPFYGKSHSDESRNKISEKLLDHYKYNDAPFKGRKHSEESKAKIRKARASQAPFSEETRRKMGESRRGNKNPFYGKKHSEETKNKISETKKKNKLLKEFRLKRNLRRQRRSEPL